MQVKFQAGASRDARDPGPGPVAAAAATGLQVGVVLLSSLFLQGVLGASAVRAGVEFLPPVIAHRARGAGLGGT